MTGPFSLLVDRLSSLVDNVVVLEKADSTHRMAIRLIAQMEDEDQTLPPTVLIADRQTDGTGRLGRRWMSPAGGLYLNWLATDVPETVVPLLPILAAAAGLAALDAVGVAHAAVKWPNDLLIRGRKAGGILVHGRRGTATWTTVGIGINLVQTPQLDDTPPRPPTSLREHIGAFAFDQLRAEVAAVLIERLQASMTDPWPAVELWRRRLVHRPGDRLTIQIDADQSITGLFLGTSPDGHLRLDVGGTEHLVSSGDIIGG